MGIPIEFAQNMSKNLESSFIIQRAEVTYPKERIEPTREFLRRILMNFLKSFLESTKFPLNLNQKSF